MELKKFPLLIICNEVQGEIMDEKETTTLECTEIEQQKLWTTATTGNVHK